MSAKKNENSNKQVEAQPQGGKLIGVVNCKIVDSIMEREGLGKFEHFNAIVAVPRVFEKHSKLMAVGARLPEKK